MLFSLFLCELRVKLCMVLSDSRRKRGFKRFWISLIVLCLVRMVVEVTALNESDGLSAGLTLGRKRMKTFTVADVGDVRELLE